MIPFLRVGRLLLLLMLMFLCLTCSFLIYSPSTVSSVYYTVIEFAQRNSSERKGKGRLVFSAAAAAAQADTQILPRSLPALRLASVQIDFNFAAFLSPACLPVSLPAWLCPLTRITRERGELPTDREEEKESWLCHRVSAAILFSVPFLLRPGLIYYAKRDQARPVSEMATGWLPLTGRSISSVEQSFCAAPRCLPSHSCTSHRRYIPSIIHYYTFFLLAIGRQCKDPKQKREGKSEGESDLREWLPDCITMCAAGVAATVCVCVPS